jgi:hypothetical protein
VDDIEVYFEPDEEGSLEEVKMPGQDEKKLQLERLSQTDDLQITDNPKKLFAK